MTVSRGILFRIKRFVAHSFFRVSPTVSTFTRSGDQLLHYRRTYTELRLLGYQGGGTAQRTSGRPRVKRLL
ncbi:hypothetical protein K443DRAFT_683072, partial [Laccaria amethystina LaAM-08-1]